MILELQTNMIQNYNVPDHGFFITPSEGAYLIHFQATILIPGNTGATRDYKASVGGTNEVLWESHRS